MQRCWRQPRQDIKAWHGLAERLRAKQRARICAGGNASIGAADERVQAVDWCQKAAGCDKTHFYQVAPVDLAMRERFNDFTAVLACVLRFSYAYPGCVFRKEKSIFSMLFHCGCSPSFAVFCLRQWPAAISRRVPVVPSP